MKAGRSRLRSPGVLAGIGLLLFGLILVTLLAKAHVGKIPEAGPGLSGGPAESGFQSPPDPSPGARINPNFGRLPLIFEPNQGQTDSRVKFLCRTPGATVFLTANEAVFTFPSGGPGESPARRGTIAADRRNSGRGVFPGEGERPVGFDPLQRSMIGLGLREPWKDPASLENSPGMARPSRRQPAWARGPSALRMQLVEANAQAEIEGLERLSGVSNYFIGNDPGKWRTKVPHYAKVRYRDVYPGIDLVYYGNERNLEYDFVLRPGADPNLIRLAFEGAERISLEENGDLLMRIGSRLIRQRRPRIYQELSEVDHTLVPTARQIPGGFQVTEGGEIRFKVSNYDRASGLVIDPVLEYSTYLGGEGAEGGNGIAVDSLGHAFVVGTTVPADSLESGSPPSNAFITKINSKGDQTQYVTYLGGSHNDQGIAIGIDRNGYAYIAGNTCSADFPVLGAAQASFSGGDCSTVAVRGDVFAAKLGESGELLYSTYLGGNEENWSLALAADPVGNTWVSGVAFSRSSYGGFLTKLDSGGKIESSRNLGGIGQALALDADSNLFVAGKIVEGIPPVNPLFQEGPIFLMKLDPTGLNILFATPFGATQNGGCDTVTDLAIDPSGNPILTGYTASSTFPLQNPLLSLGGGRCSVSGPSFSFFLSKFRSSGSALVYSTYLGLQGFFDAGTRLAVAHSGDTYLAASQGRPHGGGAQERLLRISSQGDHLVSSLQLGEDGSLLLRDIALDSQDHVYLTGETASPFFPLEKPLHSSLAGSSDAFATKIREGTETSVSLFVPILLAAGGLNDSFFQSELTLTNHGSRDASLELNYTPAFGGNPASARTNLPAGRQRIYADALAYLRDLGIPIPLTGDQGGTLAIQVTGIESRSDVSATVRTTTAVPGGRAGLAYSAIPKFRAFTDSAYVCGLRQDSRDRSNLAVQNVGDAGEGDIVLRVTVVSGDPLNRASKVLPDITLPPGGFFQINGIMAELGVPQGYAKVERISGLAPFYAYGVINDQQTSDGSFVLPTTGSGGTIPAVVENSRYVTEVILTNLSNQPNPLVLKYASANLTSSSGEVEISLTLAPGEQRILSEFVQFLRDQQVAGVGPPGLDFAGPLTISSRVGSVFIGARTTTAAANGHYGVFYNGMTWVAGASVWVNGLQQNDQTRANLALVNAYGPAAGIPGRFAIEVFDGDTGLPVRTIEEGVLNWVQLNRVLATYAPGVRQGYVRITATPPTVPFVCYGVLNDGSAPGLRSGDGSFLSLQYPDVVFQE
ncbi:MAG: SBBP repeat-containing protein [Acidobacteriota bacterium]